MNTIIGVDCYMRYTNAEGKSHVTYHRVISGGRFVQNTIEQCRKENIKAEQITVEQYNKEK